MSSSSTDPNAIHAQDAQDFATLQHLQSQINDLPRLHDRKVLEFHSRKVYDCIRKPEPGDKMIVGLQAIHNRILAAKTEPSKVQQMADALQTMLMQILSVEGHQMMEDDALDEMQKNVEEMQAKLAEKIGTKRKRNQVELAEGIDVGEYAEAKVRRFGTTLMKVVGKNDGEERSVVRVRDRNAEGEGAKEFAMEPGDVLLERRVKMHGQEWWYGTWKAEEVRVVSRRLEPEKWEEAEKMLGEGLG